MSNVHLNLFHTKKEYHMTLEPYADITFIYD